MIGEMDLEEADISEMDVIDVIGYVSFSYVVLLRISPQFPIYINYWYIVISEALIVSIWDQIHSKSIELYNGQGIEVFNKRT